jgi:hypothetical protein
MEYLRMRIRRRDDLMRDKVTFGEWLLVRFYYK